MFATAVIIVELIIVRITLLGEIQNHELVNNLKKVGLSDAAILDTTLVVSYFNFVNRIVLTLGVHLEQDSGKGYKY